MQSEKFTELLDQTDRELDAFPFWASFKRACAAYSIKNVEQLTPGRQAILILWQASSQTKDNQGNIVTVDLEGEMMQDRLEKLKEELIDNFNNEELDDYALERFFKSVNKQINR